GDDEELAPAVARPADVVELVLETAEAARRTLALVLLLVGLVADAGGERDPRPVGRPDDLRDVLLQVGQPTTLAAARHDDVALLRVALATGRARELRAVGRPSRL